MADEAATDEAIEPDEAEAPVPALSSDARVLLERLQESLREDVLEHAFVYDELVVRVAPDSWRRSAEVAKSELECDYLSFVSGIDWMPRPTEGEDEGGDTSAPVQPNETTYGAAGSAGRFQVFARVASTTRKWGVTLKCDVNESVPTVESWVGVYPGADWHERECWEMFGISFDGHPKLRHLYLPSEFEGHPLRKDYALLARDVKPWPGLVDVEDMPEAPASDDAESDDAESDDAESEGEGES